MVRARAAREREWVLFDTEVQRRLALSLDDWEPTGSAENLTSNAQAHLKRRAQTSGGGDAA